MKHQDALDLLARETARARRGLALERAIRLGLPLLLAIGVWAVLAWGRTPDVAVDRAELKRDCSGCGVRVARRARAHEVRAPNEAEARARLAVDSRLDVAAFESLRDRPSRYDAFSMALWTREREHAIARAETARAGPPQPQLDGSIPTNCATRLLSPCLDRW